MQLQPKFIAELPKHAKRKTNSVVATVVVLAKRRSVDTKAIRARRVTAASPNFLGGAMPIVRRIPKRGVQ